METLWKIELFGGLRARCGDPVVERFHTQKTASLLAYLALKLRPRPREILINLSWPEAEPEVARNSLSAALSSLRRQLEADRPAGSVLVADRSSAGLNSAAITTDVAEFENALRQAGTATNDTERVQWLAKAVELYGGELLPGFAMSGCSRSNAAWKTSICRLWRGCWRCRKV
jgi:DNA-binding SARP family transcriptional activator